MAKRTCIVDDCEKPSKARGFCGMHAYRVKQYGDPHTVTRIQSPATPETRFWAQVDKDGPGGCWLWTGHTSNGYGRFSLPSKKKRAAHRVAYEWLVGPIPEGLELDHLCRVRNCVNPDHLEPVTAIENVHRSPFTVNSIHASRTHCPQGHEYDEQNTYINQGHRYCRTCRSERRRSA